jgi:hypothetical protein
MGARVIAGDGQDGGLVENRGYDGTGREQIASSPPNSQKAQRSSILVVGMENP